MTAAVEQEILDAYSETVTSVAERALPSVAGIRTQVRGRPGRARRS